MADLTYIPKPDQVEEIKKILSRDKNCNYSRLEFYLKQIIGGKNVTFELLGDKEITIPAKEAWGIVVDWSQNEGNLPVGDRKNAFNMKSRATHLLDYLQTNISGKTAEAAGNYRLILEEAKHDTLTIPNTSQIPEAANLQKIFDLRRTQIQIQQAGLIGKIITKFEASKILEKVPDPATRAHVLQMIAAANINFRDQPKNAHDNFTAEKIHQLLLHQPGLRDTNSVMRLIYSKSAQNDFTEIAKIINESIQEVHGNNEAKYLQEMSNLKSINSLAPTLESIPYLLNSIDFTADIKEKAALTQAIRSQIISSAMGEHQSGKELLKAALLKLGYDEISVDHFEKITPFVEEMQVKQRHLLLGDNPEDYDPRLIATSGLAQDIGVDFTVPWIKQVELNSITERVVSPLAEEFYLANPNIPKGSSTFSLQQAFDFEFAKGTSADPEKLSEIANLMSKHADFARYHNTVDGNFGYQFQEFFSKNLGKYQAFKKPIDRFNQKVWGGISNIDDVIRWPARQTALWWEKTLEEHPWLNPGALIAGKWVEYQTGIAIRINKWANAVNAKSWLSGFAKNIGDFTEGFIKHEGNWGGTGIFFVQRKIGNVLDWSAKHFTKHGTFSSLRGAIAKAAWKGFTKLAPKLAEKMVLSGLSKVIIGVIAGEMTMGVSIAIQIGWEVLMFGFKKISDFITNKNGFRDWVINRLPIIVGGAIMGMALTAVAALGAIPGAIAAVIAGLVAAVSILVGSLATLFASAAVVAAAIVGTLTLVWFGIISPTFQLDSSSSVQQVVGDIVCNLTGSEPPSSSSNSKLAAGKCVYQLLTQFGLNPLNKGNATGGKFLSFAAGLGNQAAAAEAARSATKYLAFQCVGFDVVVDIMTGGQGGFTQASFLDTINPPGYTFVAGVGSCSPGDFFVDKNGAFGHTGLFVELAGANIVCLDANSDSNGLVRDETTCRWPTNKIAGCLKKK